MRGCINLPVPQAQCAAALTAELFVTLLDLFSHSGNIYGVRDACLIGSRGLCPYTDIEYILQCPFCHQKVCIFFYKQNSQALTNKVVWYLVHLLIARNIE